MSQLTEQQLAIKRRVERVVAEKIAPRAVHIESTSEFPAEAAAALAGERLFALAMPRSHGGEEADALSLALMVETISRVSPSSALLVFPSNAVLRTIAICGSGKQKDRLFPELAAGDVPMAFCLTEPDHGSDAGAMETRAERQGGHYVVNGSKAYITLGPNARYYLTFVRTGPGRGAAGVSALLIPRDASGLSFGPAEKKMGLHGSITTMMYLDNCKVPAYLRLWGEGEGWRVLTEVSNPMRVWGAASMAVGAAQGLLDLALEHAQHARFEGRSLMTQQGVAFALADMKMAVEAARSLNRRVCAMVDDPETHHQQIESYVSMAKCFAADTAVRVANLASEVMGQAMAGADSLAGRLFTVAKGIQIFDGSNQVQRLIVSRNLVRDAARG